MVGRDRVSTRVAGSPQVLCPQIRVDSQPNLSVYPSRHLNLLSTELLHRNLGSLGLGVEDHPFGNFTAPHCPLSAAVR